MSDEYPSFSYQPQGTARRHAPYQARAGGASQDIHTPHQTPHSPALWETPLRWISLALASHPSLSAPAYVRVMGSCARTVVLPSLCSHILI